MFEPYDIIYAFWVVIIGGLIGFLIGILQVFLETPEVLSTLL